VESPRGAPGKFRYSNEYIRLFRGFFLTSVKNLTNLLLVKIETPPSLLSHPFLRALLTLPLFASLALAQSSTWTGGGDPDPLWSNADNWAGGTIPGATSGTTNSDTATIEQVDFREIEVDANRIIGSIHFPLTTTLDGFRFFGADLNLAHGGSIATPISQSQAGDIVFENNLIFHPADATSNGFYAINHLSRAPSSPAARDLRFEGNLSAGTTTGSFALNMGTNFRTQVIFEGVISDGGAAQGLSLNIAGNSGTTGNLGVVLDNANTYTGGTTITATSGLNLVGIGNEGAFGSGPIEVTRAAFYGRSDSANNIKDYTIANALHVNVSFNHLSPGTAYRAHYIWNGGVVLQGAPGGEVTFSKAGSTTVTFASTISEAADNIALRLVGSGSNFTTFGAANTFTGGVTFVNNNPDSGTYAIAPGANLGTGNLVAERWAPFGVHDVTFSNNIVLDGGFNLITNSQRMTINGNVLIGEAQTSGGVGLSNPTFRAQQRGTSGYTIHGLISNAETLRQLSLDRGIHVWTHDNIIEGVVSVYASTTLQIGDGGTGGLIGTGTVELAVNSNQPNNFARLNLNRSDSYEVENAITGFGILTIDGGGVATLTGASTFANPGTSFDYANEAEAEKDRAVIVTSGSTLRVDGSHVFVPNPIDPNSPKAPYVIQSGATLGGSGTIDTNGYTIDLVGGSFLSPGSENAPGTLTLNATLSLTELDGNSGSLIFRLGSVSDQLTFGDTSGVVGEVNFGDFDFVTGAGFGGGTYDLFVFGDMDPSFNNLLLGSTTTGTINGFEAELFLNSNTLSLTVVPEPATVATILGALALVGVAFWRRRQGRQLSC